MCQKHQCDVSDRNSIKIQSIIKRKSDEKWKNKKKVAKKLEKVEKNQVKSERNAKVIKFKQNRVKFTNISVRKRTKKIKSKKKVSNRLAAAAFKREIEFSVSDNGHSGCNPFIQTQKPC